jgi:predicted amidohydrolase YtcJ
MHRRYFLTAVPAILLILLFSFKTERPADIARGQTGTADGHAGIIADRIIFHGKIITVDSADRIAGAVAIKDGRILAVGSWKEIAEYKGDATQMEDLQGKTLIPGIVDGHSHLMFQGLMLKRMANLSAPPMGDIRNMAGLIAALQKYKADKKIGNGGWIIGFGYDQEQLAEKRHPTRKDLDAAFPDNPVLITHISGHMLVVNSYALKLSGIDSSTKDPPGGVIVREPGTQQPAGLLQEKASALVKRSTMPKLTEEEEMQLLKEQEDIYAGYGITTAQEGRTPFESVQFLERAAANHSLYIDIASLVDYSGLDKLLADTAHKFGVYDNHLKLEGFKLVADGSPQGKTAFFSEPYLTDVPGCSGDECRGVPTVTQDQFNQAILKGFRNNIQSFVHCNGDATIDMYIRAVKNACQVLGVPSLGRRPVVIHSQFVRPDQLDSYKEMGFVPSFFTNHTFFWGDEHIRNLGERRGYFESPLRSALKKNIVFANHTDYPTTSLNQMFLLWTSVARKSRSGQVIGPEERLTPMEGIRAFTMNSAYLYFEEKQKGSIEKGKMADFAVLSDDPLTIGTDKIKDITVLETIKEGKTIFKKE